MHFFDLPCSLLTHQKQGNTWLGVSQTMKGGTSKALAFYDITKGYRILRNTTYCYSCIASIFSSNGRTFIVLLNRSFVQPWPWPWPSVYRSSWRGCHCLVTSCIFPYFFFLLWDSRLVFLARFLHRGAQRYVHRCAQRPRCHFFDAAQPYNTHSLLCCYCKCSQSSQQTAQHACGSPINEHFTGSDLEDASS